MKKILICILFISMSCYADNNAMDIQKNIFKYNLDILHNQFKNEIERINQDNKQQEEKNSAKINDGIKINLTKYRMILEDVIKNSNSNLVLAEAYFRLSLINLEGDPGPAVDPGLRREQGDIGKSIKLLNKGLENIQENSGATDLYIKMNYFAGGLSLLKEDYSESIKFYQTVLNTIKNTNSRALFSEEKIRSLIGQGDCEYLQSNFDSANEKYKLAQASLQGADNLLQDVEQNIEALLDLRIILTTYRNGDYQSSLDMIKIYSYKREIFGKYISLALRKDIINIAGIALFELKNKKIFEEIAQDKIYGDFGKEIILQSFPLYIQSGDTKFIDSVAQSIKNNFYLSINYFVFLKEWIEINKNNDDKDKFFNVSYFGITEISRNSLWRERFMLNQQQDERRKNIILTYSIPAAEYYYEQGLQNKSKNSFIRSAEIYNARVEENDRNDNIGLLLQKYSESLYMAEDYTTALSVIDRGLKFNLSDSDLKSGLFLRLKITRALSSDVKDTTNENYKLYENAVDSFIVRFPDERQARDGLFESAKRAELLGSFDNAKIRYERLLSYIPNENTNINRNEKNKNSKSLATVLLKIKNNNEENVNIASNLESYSNKFSTSNQAQVAVKSVNSKLAQNYYGKLNYEGKIRGSADFLSLWAQNNNTNPDAAKVYIDSIKIYAQLQEWKRVLLMSQNFSDLYPNNARVYESFFWQGKANESLLLFSQAAENYEKSANISHDFPSLKEKIFAINRANSIYISLNKKEEAVRSLEIKSKLQINNHENPNEVALSQVEAAKIFLNLNENEKAKIIYLALSKAKNISKNIRNESKINFLISSVKKDKNAIQKIDLALESYIRDKKDVNKNFLDDSINFINTQDRKMFIENNNLFHNNFDENLLNKMYVIVKRIEKRSSYLKSSSIDAPLLASTYSLIGKLSEIFADNYSYSYYNYQKNEVFLKYSERYHTAAKKFYSAALSIAKTDDSRRIEIYLEARRYFNMPENLPPQFLFNDQVKDFGILQNLYSDNRGVSHIASKVVSKKD